MGSATIPKHILDTKVPINDVNLFFKAFNVLHDYGDNVKKYTDLIKGYVDRLAPQIGGVWHSDEMKVNINGKLEWVWNVMGESEMFKMWRIR